MLSKLRQASELQSSCQLPSDLYANHLDQEMQKIKRALFSHISSKFASPLRSCICGMWEYLQLTQPDLIPLNLNPQNKVRFFTVQTQVVGLRISVEKNQHWLLWFGRPCLVTAPCSIGCAWNSAYLHQLGFRWKYLHWTLRAKDLGQNVFEIEFLKHKKRFLDKIKEKFMWLELKERENPKILELMSSIMGHDLVLFFK